MAKLEDAIGETRNPLSGSKAKLSIELVWQYFLGAILVIAALFAGLGVVNWISGAIGAHISSGKYAALLGGTPPASAPASTPSSSAGVGSGVQVWGM